ncbi:MAG TPA: asparagine synthase (glutamine-hydrolyzing) [Acetobacteraceae bacterium]|jgi:asparagine synthase (glutamine-hydrolysing)
MCGIVAVLAREGRVSPQLVARAVAQLAHRGPDGCRQWIAPGGQVGLGHARLAVIDLETGQQPLASEDGQVLVVVNGEFYGHSTIRRELEARGHRFSTRSDSEILVHLWEEQGIGCLEQLRGEFAFVVWDAARELLFAARDRFGAKPLYYAQREDGLFLASEAKALFAAGVPARWDHQSFFEMCHLYYPQGRTLFAGVHQVPPGHCLLATVEGCRLQRYWDLDFPRRDAPMPERLPEEHVALLRVALEEAVGLRLQADVPVGCYLSGGLDSSLVLGIAAHQAGAPIDAFTIAFDGDSQDESAVAAETARHVGARHHLFRVTEEQIADHFSDAIWHSETINPNTNGVAKYLLSHRVREAGLRVVLTGEGADEVAAGYDFLVRDMMLRGRQGTARRERELGELRGPGLPAGGDSVPTGLVRERLGFVPSWVVWFAEAAAHSRALWSPAFSAEVAGRDPYRGFLDALDIGGQVEGREPVHQSLYLWTKSMFANLLLNQLSDRMEMSHGVEGRLPFLDGPVVALLRDMPVSMKIRGAQGKHALREAARPYCTETVLRRRKQAFLAPPPSPRPDGRLFSMLQDLLRSDTMAAVPFFDPRAIRRFLDGLPRIANRTPQVWAGLGNQLVYLASACILQGRFALGD